MADLTREAMGMHAHNSKVLNYGHFGTASYNTQDQEWHFLRRSQEPGCEDVEESDQTGLDTFDFLGDPIHHRSPTTSASVETIPKTSSTNFLSKTLPDLCAACDVKIPAFRTAEAVEEEHARPPCPATTVFGGALLMGDDNVQSGTALSPIMVSVHGPTYNQVVFSCLDRESIPLHTPHRRLELDVPKIAYKHAAIWSSPVPLEHLIVSSRASSHKDSRFAAVSRFRTSLFQPQFHRSGPAQPLQPNHIVDITLEYTGGQEHTNAMFHPKWSNIIAIVDAGGTWSTWEITGKSPSSVRITRHARLIASGNLPTERDRGTINGHMSHADVWHGICWLHTGVQNQDRIAVCSRNSLFFFDSKGGMMGRMEFEAGKGLKLGVILDLKIGTSCGSTCFVLTSTHLLWLSAAARQHLATSEKQSLTILVAWNHFRGRNDISLAIHVIQYQHEMKIMLSSRRTKIISMYTAAKSATHEYSITDPVLMNLPFSSFQDTCRLCFKSAQIKVQHGTSEAAEPWLCKVLLQHADGQIEESTMLIHKATPSSQEQIPPFELLSLPKTGSHYRQTPRYLDVEEIDDFVVNDLKTAFGDMTNQTGNGIDGTELKLTAPMQKRIAQCNLLPTYEELLASSLRPTPDQASYIERYLSTIEDHLKHQAEPLPNHLLSDVSVEPPYIAEIEEDSALLSKFVEESDANMVDTIKNNSSIFLRQIGKQSLLEIYESFEREWMLPLSSTMPDRARITRERLARQIAFDLWLSKVIVYHSHGIHKDVPRDDLWGHNSSRHQDLSSSVPDGSMSQPIHNNNTYDITTNAQMIGSRSVLTSYLNFGKPLPTPFSSDGLEEVVAHLAQSIDEDPGNYSYNDVEAQRIANKAELKHSQLDPRARRKAEKLAQTRKRQLEKQDLAKKVTFDARSIVPIVSSSQLPYRGIQSSQVAPPGSSQTEITNGPSMNMSQPEKGPFGARHTKRTKNSKGERRAGF